MARFSEHSEHLLDSCHYGLQRLFREVVRHFDCRVICGYRSQGAQEEAFETGRSRLHFPNSKHNTWPSLAVDVVPYPIDWDDLHRFRAFGGFALGVASQMDIKLRWGGDWDGDWEFRDQRFIDMPHFELVDINA